MVFYVYLQVDFLGQGSGDRRRTFPWPLSCLNILLSNEERDGGGRVPSGWYLAALEEMQLDSPHSQSSIWTRIER